MVHESDGILQITLELSRPLPDDITVLFRYLDISATGKFMSITLTYMGAHAHTHITHTHTYEVS